MKHIVVLALLVLLAACAEEAPNKEAATPAPPSPADVETERLHAFLDAEFEEYLHFSPLSRTRVGDRKDYDKLDDESEAAMDRQLSRP